MKSADARLKPRDIPNLNLVINTCKLDSIDLEIEGKTKSQRLRNTLHVYWSQNKQKETFKEFYANEMERIILHYKGKLY